MTLQITRSSPLPLLPKPVDANDAESRGWRQLSPGHVSRTGPEGTGAHDPGYGGLVRGQGQVLTAATPLWVIPVAGPSVTHTSCQWLAAPQSAPRRWPWDHLSLPTACCSHGSDLRSSPGPGSSWSSCRAQGVAATNGLDHLPAAPRGASPAGRLGRQNPQRAGDGQEGSRSRKDLRPLHVLRTRDLLDPQLVLQVCRRMSSASQGTPHPALLLVQLRERSERL